MSFQIFAEKELALLREVESAANRAGGALYMVGGVIRDSYFNIPSKDVDLIIAEGEPERVLAELDLVLGTSTAINQRFLTATIPLSEDNIKIRELDFVIPRKERYPKPAALPETERGSLDEDLQRRDFSINAVAVPLSKMDLLLGTRFEEGLEAAAFDPQGGIRDLKSRTVRVLHPKSFEDDPTRIVRAFRYLRRIQGKFDSQTSALIEKAAASRILKLLSPHRRLLELRRSLSEQSGPEILSDLNQWGLLATMELFPEGREGEFVSEYCRHAKSFSDTERLGLALWIALFGSEGISTLKRAGISKKEIGELQKAAEELR